ncbi:MAG: type II toxin-antitoxin system VapB family antitoxin [Burkholderiales bacterium]|nr:type II toxin-antitoxin system VapB family antitoxin [Burkholderiales bacterium]
METRTNIVLDDALVEQAMKKAGVTTKKAAIEAALRAFVREPDWDFIAAMEGSGAVADDYSPQAAFAHDPDLAWAVAEPAATWSGPATQAARTQPATALPKAHKAGGSKADRTRNDPRAAPPASLHADQKGRSAHTAPRARPEQPTRKTPTAQPPARPAKRRAR